MYRLLCASWRRIVISLECLIGHTIITVSRIVSGSVTRWAGCRPAKRQRIYYANHSSHLDIMLLWASLPSEVRATVRPAAAADYWGKTPLRRYLALKVFNSILIDRVFDGLGPRAAMKSIQSVVEGLGESSSLIIFPEGTRGTGGEIAEFKSGVYHIAKRIKDIELIPVYMENLNRILPKGKFIPLPLLSNVTFGAPLYLENGEGKNEFLERLRQALLDLKEI